MPGRTRAHKRLLRVEQCEARLVLTATPITAEVVVSADESFVSNLFPIIERNVIGETAVVWSRQGSTSEETLVARVYDSLGNPQSNEFRINPDEPDYFAPSSFDMAMDDAGNFLVVYQLQTKNASQTTPDLIIQARKYNRLGVAQGNPINLFESDQDDSQVFPRFSPQLTSPKIALDSNGDFALVTEGTVLTQTGGIGTSGIYALRYNSAGQQQGEEILVAADTTFDHRNPKISMAANGDFVVAWEVLDTTNTLEQDIATQRYSAAGSPQGSQTIVNSQDFPSHSEPAVAMSADGTHVVSWTTFDQDGDGDGIYARAYTAAGDQITDEFQVHTTTRRDQNLSAVSIDADANTFAVAWNGYILGTPDNPGDHRKIVAQQYEFERVMVVDELELVGVTAVGGEFVVNPANTSGQGGVGSFDPSIAGTSCGDLAVAWRVNAPSTTSGIQARFYAVDRPAGAVARHDSDGDALPDCWELNGYDVEVDGMNIHVPLDEMGADPLRKDIFVEIDYMGTRDAAGNPTGHASHEPKENAMAIVREAFANAPVKNLDGSTGIDIHIDYGRAAAMHPGPDGIWHTADDVDWIDLSDADVLAHKDLIGTVIDDNYQFDEFDEIKHGPDNIAGNADDRFSAARAPAFHYSTFLHNILPNGTSGISRNGDATFFEGAGDFIVSLGNWNETAFEQAGTFMHELGHNLGLSHGGSQFKNYKPNYLSVMTYAFQTRGLITEFNNNYAYRGTFDYSRMELDTLDEFNLDEPDGVSGEGFDPDSFGTVYFCNGNRTNHFASLSSVDWNCNGNSTELDRQADINDSGGGSLLTGHDDWSNLVYSGGGIGSLGAATNLPMSTEVDSLTVAENDLLEQPHRFAVNGPGLAISSPAAAQVVTFTVSNLGTENDTYDLSLTSSLGWADPDSIPSTLAVPAGSSREVEVAVEVPPTADASQMDQLTLTATSGTIPQLVDLARLEVALETDDFGDAPDSYGTLLQSNGARHTVVNGFHLGSSVDVESDGQPNSTATGDDLDAAGDDDNGILTFGDIPRGVPETQIQITIVNTAGVANPYLDAWIDFNQDGSFTSPGERVASLPVVEGVFRLGFPIPATALLGETFARVRLHQATGPGLGATGPATSGEVEDNQITIVEPTFPYHNERDSNDVDDSGEVSLADAIDVVTRLRLLGSPTLLLPVPLPPERLVPPFYDVDQNNMVTINDALEVVAFLRIQLQNGNSEAESIRLTENDLPKLEPAVDLLDQTFAENDPWELDACEPLAPLHALLSEMA